MKPYSLPWVEPLDLARSTADETLVLLYSGVRADYSGRFSLLACDAAEEIRADSFTPLAAHLSTDRPVFANAWFAYLGYGLKDGLEALPADARGVLAFPLLWAARFNTIYLFDHEMRMLTAFAVHEPTLPTIEPREPVPIAIENIESNMSRAEYFSHVAHIVEAIASGQLYQANLTRKFHGRFEQAPDSFALFEKLAEASPAPYSAYIRNADGAILSSSPERFLHMDISGEVTSRPIKGSAPRSKDEAEDTRLREALQQSPKDRAENLMIVDLMRNDFSRACVPGSVRADSLFDITAHTHVHHLSSTVSGQRAAEVTPLDLVKACFPPGSMTGAPKISAISLCTQLERLERGVYSGALGWFGGDGSLDLSVVIRTLLVQGNQFEFQVGGGIVADSTPEGEWKETLVKAAGMAKALQIPLETLENL